MATLHAFALFHLNLAFSSVEEEQRATVVRDCYRPLLALAQQHPIGIEATAYTLEAIRACDAAWLEDLATLIGAGKIEFIGSGHAQAIGPLLPADVVAGNLRLGNLAYREMLGVRPKLALVNEQAYAGGLVALYREAGYCALLMDWDNPAAHHPEWDSQTQYLPQYAVGPQGEEIALIWSNTTLFQQLQRFAHGDTELKSYRDFVRGKRGAQPRALCLYASDAEVFDFRPGRFRTEEPLGETGEWARIETALAAAVADGAHLVAPSAVLELMEAPGAGQRLTLESAACPVPVKKQRKYNLARWAVTGRDNLAINAACERIYRGMLADEAGADWKELCHLWACDYRTHLTQARWAKYCARLKAAEIRWSAPLPPPPPLPQTAALSERFIDIATPHLKARLDRRRGLALQSVRFAPHARAAIGGLPHGTFDDIALAADWYTGDCVFEAPGEHKLTDLEWCEARVATEANGDMIAHARIDTPKGVIEKRMRFSAAAPRIDFDLTFHWDDWGKGVLRLGHFTLLPEAFATDALIFATTNGGARETFAPAGQRIDHGAPVSFLVSSSHGMGMTEGWAEIGDGRTGLRIEVDRATAPLLGLLSHRPAGTHRGSQSLFCQLQLSALELDDTRKPGCYQAGARRFRFSISAV